MLHPRRGLQSYERIKYSRAQCPRMSFTRAHKEPRRHTHTHTERVRGAFAYKDREPKLIASKIQRAFSRLFVPSREPDDTTTKMASYDLCGGATSAFHKNITSPRGFLFFLYLFFPLSATLSTPVYLSSSLARSPSLSLPLCGCMTLLKTDHLLSPLGLESPVSRLATTINKFFGGKRRDQKESPACSRNRTNGSPGRDGRWNFLGKEAPSSLLSATRGPARLWGML